MATHSTTGVNRSSKTNRPVSSPSHTRSMTMDTVDPSGFNVRSRCRPSGTSCLWPSDSESEKVIADRASAATYTRILVVHASTRLADGLWAFLLTRPYDRVHLDDGAVERHRFDLDPDDLLLPQRREPAHLSRPSDSFRYRSYASYLLRRFGSRRHLQPTSAWASAIPMAR